MRVTYYTKKQLEIFFKHWGVTEELPKRGGTAILVMFPDTSSYLDGVAEVLWSDKKSDSGERLYEVRTGKSTEVLGPIVSVFQRDDGESGGNHRCQNCGAEWKDHIAPGGKCPGTMK